MFALYKTLLAIDPDSVSNVGSTIINENVFATDASIVLKDKNDGVYTADISFSLDMLPDSGDDLVVTLTGTTSGDLGTWRLAGTGPETAAAASKTGTGMVYTLADVQIVSDETLTLTLTGSQTLTQGAYLYTADDYTTSQTFVGIASGIRNVNLSVDLSFRETAPTAAFQYSTASKTTALTGTRLDTGTQTVSYVLTTASDSQMPAPITTPGTGSAADSVTTAAPTPDQPEASEEPETVPCPDGTILPDETENTGELFFTGGAIQPDADSPAEAEIDDDAVPMGAIPQPEAAPIADRQPNTGDSSHQLLLLCVLLLSGSALVCLTVRTLRDR
jgi:hypothetical protein